MPSQAQLEQEERDMALARQLQAEEEQVQSQRRQQQQQHPQQQQQQQQQQAYYPSPSHPAGTTVTLSCPNCHALNHVAIAQQGLQHMCGSCHRLLPPATGAGVSRAPAQQQKASQGGPAQMVCPSCNTMNQVAQRNMNGPTQFVCGSCRTMLSMPAPAPAPQQRQAAVAPAAPDGVEQGVLIHKVRCGRCPSVNAVKGGSGTQFRCGSCSTINEIP